MEADLKALEELEKFARERPLAGANRVPALFGRMVPLADATLEELRRQGCLVVSEVNSRVPNAKSFHYPDGSHAIVIFSGLIDFYEKVAKILFGGTNVYVDGKELEMPGGMQDVVANLQVLFERWTPDGIAADGSAGEEVKLTGEHLSDAAMLADAAVSFALTHEFGHVLYYKRPRGRGPAVRLTRRQELLSDAAGMRNLVLAGRTPGRARMNLAGVVVSLRVLAVFADLGHVFGGDHPLPALRLKRVLESVRSFCRTERDFWSLTPIAFSFDEQLSAAGARAMHRGENAPLTWQHSFSRLSAMLENAVRRGSPGSSVAQGMAWDFREATPAVLRKVAETAARMMPVVPVETGVETEDVLWKAKGEVLRAMYDGLSERARRAFESAFAVQARGEGV